MSAIADTPPAELRDPARLTIDYTDGGDGWITAQIVEFPAAISQGRSRHEAWVNVLAALRDLTHEPTAAERVALIVQARLLEPLLELRARWGDTLRHALRPV